MCLLGILHIRIGIQTDQATKRYFLLSYITLILFDGTNLAGQLMRGVPGGLIRAALYISNFVEFLSPVVLVYIVTVYLFTSSPRSRSASPCGPCFSLCWRPTPSFW